MSLTIVSRPQLLSPAYNPMYIYATSSETARSNFSYGVYLATYPGSVLLNPLDVLPRYDDQWLEADLSKMIQSRLGTLVDDVDINDNTQVFVNTPSSGYRYTIAAFERYLTTWEFTGATVSPFYDYRVIITGEEQAPYESGDVIFIEGLARTFDFDSIVLGTNSYAQLNMSDPHTLVNGDTVFIRQRPPYCFSSYDGLAEVVDASNPNYIVINKLYNGGCAVAQRGTATQNAELDGTAVVVLTGSSYPYEVVIDKFATFSAAGTYSGTTRYIDSRIEQYDGSITNVLSVFNAAVGVNDWNNFNHTGYAPLTNGYGFLTDLPNNWTVRPENDCYLNYWTADLNYHYSYLILTTPTGSYQIINEAGTPSTIQSVNVGPNMFANCHTVEMFPAGTGEFLVDGGWLLTSTGNATASIINSALAYDFTGIGGIGRIDARFEDILTPGQIYTVTIEVTLNSQCEVQLNNGIGTMVTAGQTGVFSATFSASQDYVIIRIDGLSGTPACRVSDISITYEGCELVNCNTATYSIQLTSWATDDREVVSPFESPGAWEVDSYDNGLGSISGTTLIYEDDVEFGGTGIVIAIEEDSLDILVQYEYVINISNNSECQVYLGPSGNVALVATASQTGTYSGTFTATDTDFVIAIIGTDAVGTNGCIITSISVIRTTPIVVTSETRTFNVDCSCEYKYFNKALLFMDRMGSFVPFNMELNHKEMVKISRDGYSRHIGGYVQGSQNGYSYKKQDSSYRQYSATLEEEWDLNSDWLSETESVFFEQVMTSPSVYIKKDDGVYYPVRVRDLTYDRKKKNNKKLIAHKMFVIFTNENGVQTG